MFVDTDTNRGSLVDIFRIVRSCDFPIMLVGSVALTPQKVRINLALYILYELSSSIHFDFTCVADFCGRTANALSYNLVLPPVVYCSRCEDPKSGREYSSTTLHLLLIILGKRASGTRLTVVLTKVTGCDLPFTANQIKSCKIVAQSRQTSIFCSNLVLCL